VLRTVRHFLELIRFSHTIFALPYALLAAIMAWRLRYMLKAFAADASQEAADKFLAEFPSEFDRWLALDIRWQEVVGILFCMVTARSFAMALNRIADRRLDADNPRTAGRHLPAGKLSLAAVVTFAVASALLFVASTALFLPNRLPLYLSVPVLLLLAGYSYAKRFTSLAHFWLGAALAFSPIAAWIAILGEQITQTPTILLPAVVLAGAVLTWVAGFDIIYACQDYESDRTANLHSVPVKLGISGALRLAAVCHVLTVALLAYLPFVYPYFGWIFFAGVAAVAILLVYEHLLVRPDDLSRVNAAFFHVNAVISLGLFAVGTLDLLVGGGGY
jgi:4-hydroxybenzoate polyprenyltransferase